MWKFGGHGRLVRGPQSVSRETCRGLAPKDIGENMKRLLLIVIALALLGAGGVYFAAETIILPKQEKIWRGLLEDLPYGLEADFEDVEFELVGLRLSIGGATIGDGKGNAVKISEIVAENSLPTALGNLVRFVLGKEEERYDTVRFIGVEPLNLEQGFELDIKELRLVDVAIGIDNELPSTIKALTGAINLDKAFSAASVGGYEIHGLTTSFEDLVGRLELMKVHDITRRNLGLIEISGFNVAQGPQSLVNLDLFRTVNFNLASLMEPSLAMSGMGTNFSKPGKQRKNADLSDFNFFHFADEFVVVGFETQYPGIGSTGVKRMMYQEEETENLASAGIVATRSYSEVRDYTLQVPGLALLSPDVGQFMKATGIEGFEFNSESDNSWDLATGANVSSGWGDFTDLIKFTADLKLGNFFPDDVIEALAWSQDMTMVEGGISALLEPKNLSQKFQSGQEIYGAITLVSFDYLIENKGLIERLYRYAEVALGMPESDLKALVDGQLQMMQDDPALPASQLDDIAALQAFVANPVSLRINLSPPQPVSINAIMAEPDEEKALEMLGLTITANEGLQVSQEQL